jgi:hypothetical protein
LRKGIEIVNAAGLCLGARQRRHRDRHLLEVLPAQLRGDGDLLEHRRALIGRGGVSADRRQDGQ